MRKETPGTRTETKPKTENWGLPLKRETAIRRGYLVVAFSVAMLMLGTVPVLAADDPLTTINNLSDFIFGAIRAVGIILLGFGVVQIGLSLKSHDASQRANGIMTFFGGVLIAFAKTILDLILQ